MANNLIDKSVKTSVEVSIRLILMFIIIAWCLLLLLPFIEPVLWGVIIAVSVSPLYLKINKKLRDKPKLTAAIIVLAFFAVLIIPSFLLVSSITDSVGELMDLMENSELKIPPPDASVEDWPLIGGKVFSIWSSFSVNIEDALNNYEGEIAQAGKSVLSSIIGLTGTIGIFLLSILISGVLLATNGTNALMQKFFVRLLGDKGTSFSKLSENTIKGVTKGEIGVAFIQATLLGILFALAGVPYAGIWAVLCLILGVMQLPPTLVSIPVVFYIFSVTDGGMATLWAILIVLAGFSDNILKPILMGKGASVPMLVIFLGSLGGFIATGFLGLFTGAIVLSIGYDLFMGWVNADELNVTSSEKLEA